MNENINIAKILKGHEGETFYCSYHHEDVILIEADEERDLIIVSGKTEDVALYANGGSLSGNTTCLFPSKDQRDWNKWISKQKKFEPEEIVSLKEKYWETGNIFEMSTGEKRVVWFDNLIDAGGFIPKALFNDNLVDTNSTIGEHVVRIYAPNKNAGYFKELTKTRGKKLLWSKSGFIFTEQEIKEKLGIPEEEELIIIKR